VYGAILTSTSPRFCLVDIFIMYFPYILLVIALVIVLIERVFVKIFRAGLKLDMFYNLLVKDELEEVKETEGPASGGAGDTVDGPAPVASAGDLENSKAALEVAQSFAQSSSYFLSYLLRTLAEFVLALVLLAWLLTLGLPSIERDEFIYCEVHGHQYECAGHPQQFYMYVLFIVLFLLSVYLLCCIYNLLWLATPCFRELGRVMNTFKREARRNQKEIRTDEELLGDLYHVYYNNRDLKLLLDLLAESSGVAPSIRILSLFDKKFRAQAEPKNLRVERQGANAVLVEFEDAPTLKEIFAHIKQVEVAMLYPGSGWLHLTLAVSSQTACIYTVELRPPTPQSSCVAFKCAAGGAGSSDQQKNVLVNAVSLSAYTLFFLH